MIMAVVSHYEILGFFFLPRLTPFFSLWSDICIICAYDRKVFPQGDFIFFNDISAIACRDSPKIFPAVDGVINPPHIHHSEFIHSLFVILSPHICNNLHSNSNIFHIFNNFTIDRYLLRA